MKYFFISLLAYGILLVPFKLIFSMVPGYEMKMITFLPAVLGIFWGPMVAFGVAAANFIVDLLARSDIYMAITSSVATFFQAYIPFKLWYTLWYREEERYFFIHDMKSVAKFIYIISLTSLTISSMFGMIIESSRLAFTKNTFLMFFLNNFDFALVFGIPILILLANSRLKRYQPKKDQLSVSAKPMYDMYLYLVLLMGTAYVICTGQGMEISATAAFGIWSVMFVFMVFFAQKPIICEEIDELILTKKQLIEGMVKKYVMIGFFLGNILLGAGVIFYACLTLEASVFIDNIKAWQAFGSIIFVAIHVLFIIALIMMFLSRRRLLKIFDGEDEIKIVLIDKEKAITAPLAEKKEDDAAKEKAEEKEKEEDEKEGEE
jgi:sigma-B regulation protein RsbU (phosphoserine phosphatase)